MEQGTEDTMSFHAFEDYGIYGRGSSAEKTVPKQRTAAEDWRALNDDEREAVEVMRDPDCEVFYAPPAAWAYFRRHG